MKIAIRPRSRAKITARELVSRIPNERDVCVVVACGRAGETRKTERKRERERRRKSKVQLARRSFASEFEVSGVRASVIVSWPPSRIPFFLLFRLHLSGIFPAGEHHRETTTIPREKEIGRRHARRNFRRKGKRAKSRDSRNERLLCDIFARSKLRLPCARLDFLLPGLLTTNSRKKGEKWI